MSHRSRNGQSVGAQLEFRIDTREREEGIWRGLSISKIYRTQSLEGLMAAGI